VSPGALNLCLGRLLTGLHLGQVEAVKAVTGAVAAQWVTALLWCARDVAARRIAERGTGGHSGSVAGGMRRGLCRTLICR
jgi:hypothetical protein